MSIITEPVGSLPRSPKLQQAIRDLARGKVPKAQAEVAFDEAVKDSIARFEETGSPIITDGEQIRSSFATYPFEGLDNLDPNGFEIKFNDGHKQILPLITKGPFRYGCYAGSYLKRAKKYANKPLKQAVIAASAVSLAYPAAGIVGYSKEQFTNDLVKEAVADIRSCFDEGVSNVQIDFTEGRLAIKVDPSKGLLKEFIALNNRVLSNFTAEEKKGLGVHTCPGGDRDSTHSLDVPYAELIPFLMEFDLTNFYFQLASEPDPVDSLKIIAKNLKPNHRIFVGVIKNNDETIETAEIVRDRVLQAAKYIPVAQLGTTDDCGFSPFGDCVATARDTAFAKIKARVEGTKLASKQLGA